MAKQPRIIAQASELEASNRYCTLCEKPLVGKVAWLERDTHTGIYTDAGTIPTERSQGWFPFGMTCARKLIAELQRHVEERLHARPRLRDKHHRLVSEAHVLASLLGKMKVPPDPHVFDERGEIAWLMESYSDYLVCLFRHLEPVAELIRANAADYAGAKTEDFALVQAALTDFLAPLQNARDELQEPVEP